MAKEFWLVWKLLGDKSWGACEVFETIEQAFAYFERFGYVKTGGVVRVKTDPENGSPDGYNDVFKLEEGGKTHTRYLTKMELSE